MPDHTERPIAFTSRTLSLAEKNCSQLDKERLGIVFGVKKFHQYIFGRHFTIYMDHKPLISLFGPTTTTSEVLPARIIRWSFTSQLMITTLRTDLAPQFQMETP